MLGVNMRPQFNGLKLDENLGVAESEINKALPLGIHFVKIADQAVNITHAVNEFFIKFLVALSVVLLVTLLTLGLRVGLIVAAAVPLTLRSEEHTSELQSLMRISYAVFCLQKK